MCIASHIVTATLSFVLNSCTMSAYLSLYEEHSMGFQSPIDAARAEYEAAVMAFKQARDKVTAAKRELARLVGRARTAEQIKASRLASRRAQLLRSNPQIRAIPNKARRREALNAIIAAKDAPCVWKFYLDTMHFDVQTRAPKVYAQNRKRYELYRAGLTLAVRLLRQRASAMAGHADQTEVHELRDNARTLELHLQSLVDASPREVRVHYPSEWRVISSALRPEGSSPKSKGAQRLLALYQHIVRTHTVED